ncbi:MAG: hypothetical protein K2N15_09075, partial [Lachnospiraceae bacterium]|nr:hypothetical protein [Lachnospiraceae bacterium]
QYKFQAIPVLGMPSGFSFNRYYCSWFELVFRPAPFVSEFSFVEFSGLHCCSFVKVLFAVWRFSSGNHRRLPTEKEGFEPSRRY